ncbi:MAG: TolC family protein [Bacteroidota bacterium]|nr:TolC family protein [Bacteroidota bacterium]MDP4251497.1 TolC family protein [Bacteroidota bacterium]
MLLKPIFLTLFSLWILGGKAQIPTDTLRINLDSAEHLFVSGNFSLLAQKYNIQAQQALEIQARLYPNPNLAASYSLYNAHSKTFFPVGSGVDGGELSAQLSQLIYLAGQRNKQVKIAQANTQLASYQFFDLIRTLKYTLRTDFFNIYYLLQSSGVYAEEIKSLQEVVAAFNEQEGKGYIAEKEVVRVKAQLYTLLSEYNDLQNQINDLQSDLRLILQVKNTFISPVVDTEAIKSFDPAAYTLNTLLDSAYKNRTDLLIARTYVDVSKLNYNYQKALAVPNLTLSLAYDQQGSYVNNLSSLGAAIDLPFFNRNKGNILSAKLTTDASTAVQQSTEASVQETVFRALQKAFSNDKMVKNIDPAFLSDFDRLLHEVLINYQKRNITLLDFLDFYDSYKQNILASNNIRFNRISAFEDINFYTGTEFFHP